MKITRSTAKGKKFMVTTPEGKTVHFGAKGYTIGKKGSAKWKSYCARSGGLIQQKGYKCSGKDKYTPACLSFRQWKC